MLPGFKYIQRGEGLTWVVCNAIYVYSPNFVFHFFLPFNFGQFRDYRDSKYYTMDDPKSEATQIELSGPAEALPFENMTDSERSLMERKMIRKVDFRLLTMTILMYILNYLDRNNIASAKLAGMQTDLRLHGNQYEVIPPKYAHMCQHYYNHLLC